MPSLPSNALLKPYSVLTWQASAVKIQKELYLLDMLFQTDLNVINPLPILFKRSSEMPVMLIVRPSARAGDDVYTCSQVGWRAWVLSPVEIEPDETALRGLKEQFSRADAVFCGLVSEGNAGASKGFASVWAEGAVFCAGAGLALAGWAALGAGAVFGAEAVSFT